MSREAVLRACGKSDRPGRGALEAKKRRLRLVIYPSRNLRQRCARNLGERRAGVLESGSLAKSGADAGAESAKGVSGNSPPRAAAVAVM